MYKIFIKPNTSQYFQPYRVQVKDTTTNTSTSVEFAVETVEELAEKYKELLKKYPTEQLKAVQELDPDIIITITD